VVGLEELARHHNPGSASWRGDRQPDRPHTFRLRRRFADIGIGNWRFYIFNIADSAVTVSILLMLVLWFVAPYLGVHMPAEGMTGPGDRGDAGNVEGR